MSKEETLLATIDFYQSSHIHLSPLARGRRTIIGEVSKKVYAPSQPIVGLSDGLPTPTNLSPFD